MSQAVYELTEQTIAAAYQKQNKNLIEKETDFIVSKMITTMISTNHDKIKGITISDLDLNIDNNYLLSQKHINTLYKWLDRLYTMKAPVSDLDFGKMKVDFEYWYYQLGGHDIRFEYTDDYLLSSSEVANYLNLSRTTINKYINQGLIETVNTNSHKRIPYFIIEVWKDPVYSIRLQMIAQEKKLLNQTPLERLKEINSIISDLQLKYFAKTSQEAFIRYDGDSMDDPADYYTWQDLEEERDEILSSQGGLAGELEE
ncbi:helix-turn-helix domain-containing protein [Sporosarcina luteola]|uniref:helix-turn-helix domain-containing protein n=1 Tax=Sporosarcina luteola TaxID=582850 RepID=UPI002041E5F7|nr:helix-turn-helix domain-containing protein [Sporosarcina luteola]MCM3709380.1 helix-turn-helix domain-containing protein [Sporosarcina luteola]